MAEANKTSRPRPTAPLPDPPLVVSARSAWLALLPTAPAHWDRGGQVNPACGPKAALYATLVPRGSESEPHARAAALLGSSEPNAPLPTPHPLRLAAGARRTAMVPDALTSPVA